MSGSEQTSPESAGRHMLKGSAWMIGLRWAVRLIGLVSTIILARLLVPADFGIVAMAMSVVGLLEILNQTGQRLAIIRHPNPERGHYDTGWTLSVLVGLAIALAILLIAPATEFYFHEPRAVPVMRWLALRAAIGGFENIGVVDFRRGLRFDRFFVYNVGPKVISFAVTLILAFLLRNYWALVAGILTSQLAMVVASYVMHPYRPRFSLAKGHELYSFSGWTLFRSIGLYVNTQVDLFAVGRVFGAASMGRYAVGADLAGSPLDEVNGPMVAVLYPVMSRLQHDRAQVKELYLRTLAWSAVICISISIGITLVAHDAVALLLGAKWLAAEPLIGWLAISAGLLGLSAAAYTIFDAVGKPHLGARMQWMRLVLLGVAVFSVGFLLRNVEAIAFTRMAVTAVLLPALLLAAGRELGASLSDHVRILWRPCMAGAVMALVLSVANAVLAPGNLRLATDILLGAGTFTTVSLALWQASGRPRSPEQDLLSFITPYLRSARLLRFLARPSRAWREDEA